MAKARLSNQEKKDLKTIQSIRNILHAAYKQFAENECDELWTDFQYERDMINKIPVMRTELAQLVKCWGVQGVLNGERFSKGSKEHHIKCGFTPLKYY